jgi:hypothetical protein
MEKEKVAFNVPKTLFSIEFLLTKKKKINKTNSDQSLKKIAKNKNKTSNICVTQLM